MAKNATRPFIQPNNKTSKQLLILGIKKEH